MCSTILGVSEPKIVICDDTGKALITIARTGVTLDPDTPFDELTKLFVERVTELMAHR